MDLDLVHGDAAEPGGDHPFRDVRALLFDPGLRAVSIPPEHAAGPLRPRPGVEAPSRFEFDHRIGLGEAPLHVTQLDHVEEIRIEVIAPGQQLGNRQGGIWLEGLLRIQHEGALLPLRLDQREGLLGNRLAVGRNRRSNLLPLKARDARDHRLQRRLVSTQICRRRQLRIVVSEDGPHACQCLRPARIHALDHGMRKWRGQESHVEHPGQLDVHGVHRDPAGLLDSVDSARAPFADMPEFLERMRVCPEVVEHLLHFSGLVTGHSASPPHDLFTASRIALGC